jgi:chloramphenicol-sensitive protein RarD
MSDHHSQRRAGLLFGFGAYLTWGVMPLYFKAIAHVSALEIVAHRILWSLIFLGVLVTMSGRWPTIRSALGNRKVILTLLATTLLIGINWLVFIYAILTDHVLEASLGYYLNPLVNVLLGVFLLKEKLTRAQSFAAFLAGAGVAVLAAGAGSGLWISLTLAGSFALYGFLRKIVAVDSLEGLMIETALLTPLALAWLAFLAARGAAAFGNVSISTDALLILGGAVTAIPLLMFTAAARRLPYSTLGFLQYVAPSLQFLLAVLIFNEPLTTAHLVCFAAIWAALAIFSFEGIRSARRSKPPEAIAKGL